MRDDRTRVSRGTFSKGYLLFAALVSLYTVVIVPLTVFRLYRQEFVASLWEVGVHLAVAGGAGFAALATLLTLVPAGLRGWAARAILVVVVLAWYNLSFLDYQGRIIGADVRVVEGRYAPHEWLLFLAVAAAVARARSLNRHLVAIMAIVCIAGAIGLAAQRAEPGATSTTPAAVPDELYAYSPDRNVLHVVLDGMQRVFLDEFLSANPDAGARLPGFWYFPNTLAASDVTYLSFHSFLTGTAYTGAGSISAYLMEPTRPGRSVPRQPPAMLAALSENGFDVDILSAGGNGLAATPRYRQFAQNDLSSLASSTQDLWKVADYTLLRALPWGLKPLVYRNGRPYFSSRNTMSRAHRVSAFMDAYPGKVRPTNSRKTYKMLHLLTPHGPWTLGPECEERAASESQDAIRDQGRCAAAAVVRMVEALAATSMYEGTLILIHGDHGLCVPEGLPARAEIIPWCVGNANPLLLIKPPQSRGPLRVSNRPAALTDLPATVSGLLGLSTAFDGERLDLPASGTERARVFYDFQPDRVTAKRRDRVDVVVKHTVTGDIEDDRAWQSEMIKIPPAD